MSQNAPSTATKAFKPTLYILPWGLYPRRITIYLHEKRLLPHLTLVPVSVTPTGLSSVPGKPPGTVPILEAAPGVYIRQSNAILEYLEDTYAAPDLRGATPIARAKTRELLDLANEATAVFALYLHNASALFAGLEPQSRETARAMLDRLHTLLAQIEGMVDGVGPYLGGAEVSLVDCVMVATWQFGVHVYGVDIFERHSRLRAFAKVMETRESTKWEEAPEFIVEKARVMTVV